MNPNPSALENILPPHIEGIRPIDVTVEQRAQRALDQRRVVALTARFRLDSIGTPAVSRREDGAMVWVDGQHRGAVLIGKGLGDQPIPCQVYEGLSVPQEAALFRRLNDSKDITAVDLFRIAVTERDPIAVAAEKRLRLAGWTMEPGKRNSMRSLSTIYLCQENDPTALNRTLTALASSWGATPESGNAVLLKGFFMWCKRFGLRELDLEWDSLPPKLAKLPGGAKVFLAQARANSEVRNIPRPDAVADKLSNIYNKARRTRFAPAWEVTNA